MEKIKSKSGIKNAIQRLELEQSAQLISLKTEFDITFERLKPINIIKDTLNETFSDRGIKSTVTSNFLGAASGIIARKIILGKTNNPITGLIGALIENFVSNGVVKNSDKIKTATGRILEKIANKYSR
jgi:uncharacterized membrane protein YeaQ/YmgE (transglycosylase-associated protein family)